MWIWPLRRRTAFAIVALIASALTIAIAHRGSAGDGSIRVIHVKERDFVIRGPRVLRPGKVRFVVENRGPVSHELILVRTNRGPLPMRRDALTIDEDALEPRTIGALEPDGPGIRELDVRLEPGQYVMFCNMAGHFMSGMSMRFVVTRA
jgi:uncharacterized cupredoxin-like copper-binding protein